MNAQCSQSQETAANNYSCDQLKAKGFRREGLATAFEKLAAGSSGTTSATARMFSSHLESLARAENIRNRIAACDGGQERPQWVGAMGGGLLQALPLAARRREPVIRGGNGYRPRASSMASP